jgi:hypothetical protein
MALVQRALILIGGLTIVFSSVGAATAATTVTLPLYGTRMASLARGVATVTHTGNDTYKIAITLTNMPVPSTLKTTPVRHGYVAWAFDASKMRRPAAGATPTTRRTAPRNPAAALGMLIPISLHATSASTYTGSGTVMMSHMPGIIVTAEVSPTVSKPAMPFWGVLISRMPASHG